jgi:hypothetical protein
LFSWNGSLKRNNCTNLCAFGGDLCFALRVTRHVIVIENSAKLLWMEQQRQHEQTRQITSVHELGSTKVIVGHSNYCDRSSHKGAEAVRTHCLARSCLKLVRSSCMAWHLERAKVEKQLGLVRLLLHIVDAYLFHVQHAPMRVNCIAVSHITLLLRIATR